MKEIKVALDSRLVKSGDYFVPVIGENVDGHRFVPDAIKNGAVGIIEEDELYKLASKKLREIHPIVVAITGSVGKTTMRDFIYTMLLQRYKVCKGTLNTKLGLAVNIINDMKGSDEFFVAETGMDRMGELAETGSFIKPHAVVITNISETHMEKLGSLDAIKKAKAEILHTLRKDGIAFLNWDNKNIRDIVTMVPSGALVVKYDSDYRLPVDKFGFLGDHNRLNAVGAYVVAKHFGVGNDMLISGLKSLRTPKGRLNVIDGVNGSIIIDDTYNSSPVSVKYALKSVDSYYNEIKLSGRKTVVLGGMLELGNYENEGHKKVGDMVVKYKFDMLVLVGDLARKIKLSKKLIKSGLTISEVTNGVMAAKIVKSRVRPRKGDIILVKASQGIRLEKTVEGLMADPSTAKNLLVRQDARWK